MKLEELHVYNLAMELGEDVWQLVNSWDNFSKNTMGKQLVNAVDSVAANLSEGYGRFHFKESRNFGYYSRGSLFETKTWITKAYSRKRITENQYQDLKSKINTIGKMLNRYIQSIGTTNNTLREDDIPYYPPNDQ